MGFTSIKRMKSFSVHLMSRMLSVLLRFWIILLHHHRGSQIKKYL
jgi:hypothetical protein